MIIPKIEEQTILRAIFDIDNYQQGYDFANNYRTILEDICEQKSIQPDNTESSKFIQPSQGTNAKQEEADFISIMSIDDINDSWITHDVSSLPAQIIINLNDWSDITIENISDDNILNPTILKKQNDSNKVVFYIENLEQGKELAYNFDAYMTKATGKNPYITGAETIDYHGNVIKDIFISCNKQELQKVLIKRDGEVIQQNTIPLPAYISIDEYNWNDIQYWKNV